jgi:hypothetical protein
MTIRNFDRVLSWTDYTPVPTPRDPRFFAITDSGFTFNVSGRHRTKRTPSGALTFNPDAFLVTVTLDPLASWVLRGKDTPSLLRHEQGHYDISAIAARQFHDDALKVEARTEPDLRKAVRKLLDDTFALSKRVEAVYDDPTCATAHGNDVIQQPEWTLRIWVAKHNPDGRLDALSTCLPPILPNLFVMLRFSLRH